jgi:hypothetical protein
MPFRSDWISFEIDERPTQHLPGGLATAALAIKLIQTPTLTLFLRNVMPKSNRLSQPDPFSVTIDIKLDADESLVLHQSPPMDSAIKGELEEELLQLFDLLKSDLEIAVELKSGSVLAVIHFDWNTIGAIVTAIGGVCKGLESLAKLSRLLLSISKGVVVRVVARTTTVHITDSKVHVGEALEIMKRFGSNEISASEAVSRLMTVKKDYGDDQERKQVASMIERLWEIEDERRKRRPKPPPDKPLVDEPRRAITRRFAIEEDPPG